MRKLGPLLRLLAVALSAAVVLLIAPSARAAVPMCGEHAETVAAPPIVMPSRDLVLDRVAPCPSDDTSLVGQAPSDAPRPSQISSDQGPLRAWPAAHFIPSAPRALVTLTKSDVPPLPAGFATSIYRPPRLAA